MLPPGRAMLVTKPTLTGSATWANTIGIIRRVKRDVIATTGVEAQKITSGAKDDRLFRSAFQALCGIAYPTDLYPQVATCGPAKALERVQECREVCFDLPRPRNRRPPSARRSSASCRIAGRQRHATSRLPRRQAAAMNCRLPMPIAICPSPAGSFLL